MKPAYYKIIRYFIIVFIILIAMDIIYWLFN